MPPSHEKNLKYCSVKALDAESEDLLVKLQENRALDFIDECLSGGGGILVHCFVSSPLFAFAELYLAPKLTGLRD